ncbi:hypothetical protein F2P44_19090 [Massilia sp. CCM 8695]|uniref:ATP-dependent Clp protease adapter protein ClpS n=1 Tax=Massilia frigida TaxID=2609281 RepID=A0ABX0NH06_9BURK|nr:ATP-dependent Clp protease adaptor ClpS [Massilia frigida]NHZ81365.1 hypothetical protein [Massilia frigida]
MRTVVADQLAEGAKAWHWPSGWGARLAQCMPIWTAKSDDLLERRILPSEHLKQALLEAAGRAINMGKPLDLGVFLFAFVHDRIGIAASALEEHGLDRHRLACRIAHGAAMDGAERDDALAPGIDEARLVILNDDYTRMAFVVEVLESVLGMPPDQAQACMMQIHHEGRADCGVFPLAIARAKVEEVLALARERCEPLRTSLANA